MSGLWWGFIRLALRCASKLDADKRGVGTESGLWSMPADATLYGYRYGPFRENCTLPGLREHKAGCIMTSEYQKNGQSQQQPVEYGTPGIPCMVVIALMTKVTSIINTLTTTI